MGTKNTTTTTDVFNPTALSTYNALQGPGAGALGASMSNPQGNQNSTLLSNTGQAASRGLAASGAQAVSGNAAALHAPTATASNNAAEGRSAAAIGAQTGNSLFLGAEQRSQSAIGASMQYRPLQTGGTNTQSTSGAGTYAAPIIGAGLSVGLGVLGQKLGQPAAPQQGSYTPDDGGSAYSDSFGQGNQDSTPGSWFDDDSGADTSAFAV